MPRRVDHEQRRREIVTAVWAVIAEAGIESVTMRAVAAQAGVSVGGIQHYFADKEELILHSCRVMIDLAAGRFADESVERSARDTLRALLRRTIPATPGFLIGTVVWQTYVLKAATHARLAELVAETQRGTARYVTELVARARAAGDLAVGDDSDESVALRLLGACEGLALRVVTGSLTAAQALDAIDVALGAVGRDA